MAKNIIIFLFLLAAGGGGWYWFSNFSRDYILKTNPDDSSEMAAIAVVARPLPPVAIPKEVKAVYVTAPTAANPNRANYLINLVKSTELNSLVINVKDGDSLYLDQWLADLVRRLREEGIYPVARITVFQDNHLARTRPDLVLKNPDGSIFGKTGYQWVDPASREVWDFNAEIAIGALALGFMEINFDYFRFPDGRVDDIIYPVYDYSRPKKDIINNAAAYINRKIKADRPDAIISLDIFADAFLRPVDIGVGQKLTELARHFDVVAPMIYPSHYRAGNFGFENPADHPYEVVRQTLLAGKRQLEETGVDAEVRPWIQDFNMGAIYDRQKIRGQVKAIGDALKSCSSVIAIPEEIAAVASLPRNDDAAVIAGGEPVIANGKSVIAGGEPVIASRSEAISGPVIASPEKKSVIASRSEAISGEAIPPPPVICQSGWMSWNPSVIYSREKYTE